MKNFRPCLNVPVRTLVLLTIFSLHFHPVLFGQWTKTGGPPGINVNVFFNYGPFVFAGTSSQGAFRSSDEGVTWSPANRGLENATVLSFTRDNDYLYAGTDKGVFRSSDNGNIWLPANSGIETKLVLNMVIGGGFLFAGTSGLGVYRSADQGETWENANGGALDFSAIYAMCYVNGVLIVEADNYLFKTRNAGNTWFVDQGSTAFYVIKHFLVLGDTVLASARNGIFRSYDGGLNWTNFQPVLANEDTELLGFVFSNGIVFTADKTGMFRSPDIGITWKRIASTGLRFGTRFNNYFAQTGNSFFLGFDELGVFRSVDTGRSWTQSIKGFTAAATVDNSLLNVHDTIVSGTHSDGIYATANNGRSWRKIGTRNNADTLSNAIVYALLNPAPNIILAGTCGGGLYRSANNGKTWTHITDGLPYTRFKNYECDFGLTKSGNNVLLATTNGIYYSTNNGLTWNASNLAGDRISASSIAANRNVAVAGVIQGVFPFQSGIYRSSNSGVSWTLVLSLFDDIISLDGDGVDHFYGGGFFGNWRSENNGLTWNTIGTGIPDNTGGFTVKVVDTVNVFIGNNRGVYFSSNQGDSFTDASDGLDPEPNNAVQGLEANSTYLFAGLAWNAVWRRPLSDFGITSSFKDESAATILSGINIKESMHNELSLSPNPARDRATVQLRTNTAGRLQLVITDQAGKIMLQSNEYLSAGTYTKLIDVKHFSPGVYLVQAITNGERVTTKLVIIK